MIRNKKVSVTSAQNAPGSALWSVYMIETDRSQLYTGISNDVNRRFRQHLAGTGARCLRGHRHLTLKWQTEVGSRSEALRVEHRIKALSASAKRDICQQISTREGLLDVLGLGLIISSR